MNCNHCRLTYAIRHRCHGDFYTLARLFKKKLFTFTTYLTECRWSVASRHTVFLYSNCTQGNSNHVQKYNVLSCRRNATTSTMEAINTPSSLCSLEQLIECQQPAIDTHVVAEQHGFACVVVPKTYFMPVFLHASLKSVQGFRSHSQ